MYTQETSLEKIMFRRVKNMLCCAIIFICTSQVFSIEDFFQPDKHPVTEAINKGSGHHKTSEKIISIAVIPSHTTIGIGGSVNYHALATYNNGAIKEITDSVKWSSTKKSIVSIDETGRAVGKHEGSARITASFKGIRGKSQLNVIGKLVSIRIFPEHAKVEQGVLRQYKAIATYADGSTQDITSQANWKSSKTSIAMADSYGAFIGLQEGTTSIKAIFGSCSGETTLTVLPEILTKISIYPNSNNLLVHQSQELLAIGTYNNGKTIDSNHGLRVTWSSLKRSVVSMSPLGLATAKKPGSTTVTATSVFSKNLKGTTNVLVSNAKLVDITIKPQTVTVNNYNNVVFEAKGHYSDGSTISTKHGFEVLWSVNDKTGATIDSTGTATAIKAGNSVNVIARAKSIKGQATLNVTPAELKEIIIVPSSIEMVKGKQQPFSATGIYSDGSSLNVTREVIWTSNNQCIAKVSDVVGFEGLMTAHSTGITSINATLGSVTNSASVTVTPATLIKINIKPDAISLKKGMQHQFKAKAEYSDGSVADITESITWESNDNDVMDVSDAIGTKGLITAQNSGETFITAILDNVTSRVKCTVTNTKISSIILSSPNNTVLGQSQNTVKSKDTSTPPTPSSILMGESKSITATAFYTDSTIADVTQTVIWTSSDNGIEIKGPGIIKGVNPGRSADINVQLGGANSNAGTNVSVSDAQMTSIQIVPQAIALSQGCQQDVATYATYTNGATADISDNIQLSSDDQTVAKTNDVSSLQAQNGGNAIITASYSESEGNAGVSVSPATITSISLDPSSVNMYEGETQFIKAKAHYSDGTSADVTSTTVWSSSSNGVNAFTYGGEIQAVIPGSTATITASLDGQSGTGIVTVASANITQITVNPNSFSLHVDQQNQCEAQAMYDDGTTGDVTDMVTWISSDDNIASADSNGLQGLVTAINVGNGTISAEYMTSTGKILSSSSNLTVLPEVITSIFISPPNYELSGFFSLQLEALGVHEDGSFENITQLVTWQSSDPYVVSVSPSGLITTTNQVEGETVLIKASYAGLTGTANITTNNRGLSIYITPDTASTETANNGNDWCYFTAIAKLVNGQEQDVTQLATWHFNSSIGELVAPGVIKPNTLNTTPDQANITASLGSFSATATVVND